MAKATKIRVRLQAYDHVNLDVAAEKIVNAAKKTGHQYRRSRRHQPKWLGGVGAALV